MAVYWIASSSSSTGAGGGGQARAIALSMLSLCWRTLTESWPPLLVVLALVDKVRPAANSPDVKINSVHEGMVPVGSFLLPVGQELHHNAILAFSFRCAVVGRYMSTRGPIMQCKKHLESGPSRSEQVTPWGDDDEIHTAAQVAATIDGRISFS